MNDDPRLTIRAATVAATNQEPKPRECTGFGRFGRHKSLAAVTTCRICDIPLCTDCRIDHYHEGYS